VVIDGFNSFFSPKSKVIREDKSIVLPQDFLLTDAFLSLTRNDWVITTKTYYLYVISFQISVEFRITELSLYQSTQWLVLRNCANHLCQDIYLERQYFNFQYSCIDLQKLSYNLFRVSNIWILLCRLKCRTTVKRNFARKSIFTLNEIGFSNRKPTRTKEELN
jgi:hypothetical protein